MANQRVLITDHPWPDLDIEQRILSPLGVEIIDAPNGEESTLVQLAKEVDVIATCWAKVTGKVLQGASQCRLVCRMGIGLDNIDLATATSLGMLVTNVPDYCVEEVADHSIGLMLSLARNISFFHHRTKLGEYDLRAGPTMHRLRGRTLGLLGLGRIGQAVYQRARSFGMEVIAHTPSGNDYGTGCRMVGLQELIEGSDVISLHAPLTESTNHVLNAAAFSAMRPGAIVINTSRGSLIDPVALWQALQENKIAGVGLDVFEPEPPDLSDPLYKDERVIATPHAAFVSEESLTDLREMVSRQIVAVLTGEEPINIVNR